MGDIGVMGGTKGTLGSRGAPKGLQRPPHLRVGCGLQEAEAVPEAFGRQAELQLLLQQRCGALQHHLIVLGGGGGGAHSSAAIGVTAMGEGGEGGGTRSYISPPPFPFPEKNKKKH